MIKVINIWLLGPLGFQQVTCFDSLQLHGGFTFLCSGYLICDILDKTMDGKNTFHSTQIAVWQRGAESNLTLENLKPSTKHSLSVPESIEKNYPVAVKRSSPVFPGAFPKEWFDAVDDGKDSVRTSQATDMAFNML